MNNLPKNFRRLRQNIVQFWFTAIACELIVMATEIETCPSGQLMQ